MGIFSLTSVGMECIFYGIIATCALMALIYAVILLIGGGKVNQQLNIYNYEAQVLISSHAIMRELMLNQELGAVVKANDFSGNT